MTVKDLEELYDYGYWANKRLLEVLSNHTRRLHATGRRQPGIHTKPARALHER